MEDRDWNPNSAPRWRRFVRWLEPGIGVKRWLGLMVIGTALIGLGLAIVLLDIYRSHPDSPWLALLSLSALPRLLRALILGGVGIGLLSYAIVSLNRTLLAPYLRPGKPIVDVVAKHRRLGRGPRIVTIGGGTGLSILLRGLKKYSGNLTAIVTVADDGGSSGRLRRSLGLPPPGDIRACIAALSDDEDLLTQLFRYRFLEGEELNGHSFGNLFIAALAGVTGSFDQGIMEAARILSIRGTVLPSTMKDVALLADKTPEMAVEAFRIEGESQISETPGRIRRVHLEPNDPPAYPGAIQAVLNADMIVIGPGSLYTSVIPNLLVPDLVKAIRTSQAFKVFVCNVATQHGETDGYDCKQHVDAIERHIGRGLVDVVVANKRVDYPLPDGVTIVDPSETAEMMVPLYTGDFVDPDRPWRHDSDKIAETLIALWEERTGPLDLSLEDDIESLERHN
ncbi:MAG: YvcK family protein [Anaerolineaceae bacterium]|nr:MAG: YvcK family protein [Anaerolineaceae bacterium]